MAMVHRLRDLPASDARRGIRVVAIWCASIAASFVWAQPTAAQLPAVHYRYTSDRSPGAIGKAQLERGGPLPGYFQPVEVRAPRGVEVSLADDGAFSEPRRNPVVAGMLIGPAYRLKLTGIPFHEGEELFPTIEVINRLCPPRGQELRFPVVIELTQEDLELALRGNFVTRVIYLEDPGQALPVAEGEQQISMDAQTGEDPLLAADVLGKPMAILRVGGRVPVDSLGQLDTNEPCAPFIVFNRPATPRHELFPTPTGASGPDRRTKRVVKANGT